MFSSSSFISTAFARSAPSRVGAKRWNISKSNAIPEPSNADEKPSLVCPLRKILLFISSPAAAKIAVLVVKFSVIRCA